MVVFLVNQTSEITVLTLLCKISGTGTVKCSCQHVTRNHHNVNYFSTETADEGGLSISLGLYIPNSKTNEIRLGH